MAIPGERIISLNTGSKEANKSARRANKAAGFNDGRSGITGTAGKLLSKNKKKTEAAAAAAGVGGRTFAGETGFDAVKRRDAGFANVRPEQVPLTRVQRGNQSRSIGIIGAVNEGVRTRGGLSIN